MTERNYSGEEVREIIQVTRQIQEGIYFLRNSLPEILDSERPIEEIQEVVGDLLENMRRYPQFFDEDISRYEKVSSSLRGEINRFLTSYLENELWKNEDVDLPF